MMAEHSKCIFNLHEQFASVVDLQELFASTATEKKKNHIAFNIVEILAKI